MNKKTIYLIRHGETDFNKRGVVQGSGIDAELNDIGHAQAEAFYRTYKDVPFDKIYTSKLQRTTQSVRRFIEKQIPHEVHEGLNEISWGIREGKTPTDGDSGYYKMLTEHWRTGQTSLQAEGGESPEDVRERQLPILEKILSRNNEKTVLVAMHGRAMRVLLTTIFKRPLHEMDDFAHANLCLYKLEYDYNTQSFRLERANDTAHLSTSHI